MPWKIFSTLTVKIAEFYLTGILHPAKELLGSGSLSIVHKIRPWVPSTWVPSTYTQRCHKHDQNLSNPCKGWKSDGGCFSKPGSFFLLRFPHSHGPLTPFHSTFFSPTPSFFISPVPFLFSIISIPRKIWSIPPVYLVVDGGLARKVRLRVWISLPEEMVHGIGERLAKCEGGKGLFF